MHFKLECADGESNKIVSDKKETVTAWMYDTYRVSNHFVPNPTHCKYLHFQYISTTTLEMYATSASGVQLRDVVHYISSTSISRNSGVLQFKYILSVVLYTVKNILPFGESMFT